MGGSIWNDAIYGRCVSSEARDFPRRRGGIGGKAGVDRVNASKELAQKILLSLHLVGVVG